MDILQQLKQVEANYEALLGKFSELEKLFSQEQNKLIDSECHVADLEKHRDELIELHHDQLCRLLPPGCQYMDPPDGGSVEPIAQVRRMINALVAENAALKGLGDKLTEMSNRLTSSGGGYHDTGAITYQQAALDAAIDALDEIKTPATDAAIAEIGARALEDYADTWTEDGSYSRIAEHVREYANKLRGGEV